MTVVNICATKTRLSKLIDEEATGQDVIISRGGKPIARLTQIDSPKRRLRYGVLRGKITMVADFDAPLPSEIVTPFERS